MINNLEEFFESRGFEYADNSMYQYGRALYKYTFGPWVSYIIEDEAEAEHPFTLNVLKAHDGMALFVCPPDFPAREKQFFAVDEGYLFDEYAELIVDFKQKRDPAWDYQRLLEPVEEDDPRLIIHGTYTTPAKRRNVYYEDKEASRRSTTLGEKCVAVRVGSIVEGCDFDAGPFELEFPFTEEEYNKQMDGLENYVNAAWVYCNSTYYSVTKGDESIWCQWTAFDEAPTGNFEEDDGEAVAIATAAGKALFDSGDEQVEVPGYPGWQAVRQEAPGFEF